MGIAEEEGRLRLSFGAPFVPEIPFDPQPSEAFGAPLARRGILYAVSHNGSLLVTRNRMAPWLRYQQAQEDVWKWDHDFAMSPGDRLGLFGENMALLVV